jgi:hypothetical protein
MRCFYHGDLDAVAICKSCGHALCHDCCADVGISGACRNRCESDVEALNAIIQRNKSVYQKTSGVYLRNAWLFLGVAAVFAAAGLSIGRDAIIPTLGIAAFFILFATTQFVNARRFSGK